MGGVEIEFLIGLFIAATSVSQAESGQPHLVKIDFIRLIIGVVLVLLAVFGISLLNLR